MNNRNQKRRGRRRTHIQQTETTSSTDEQEAFYRELNGFEINVPGGNVTKFGDNDTLKRYMFKQYPDWKQRNQVTSIPIGRIPRIFLKGNQMTKELEDNFATIQKGETGEIEVYKSLLQKPNGIDEGIIVLPNVDGNHFRSKIAHVEIDTVIIHPKYGIFVLNIKNAKNVTEKNLVSDMIKHTRYIRLIRDYYENKPSESSISKIPVHGIICSFQAEINEDILHKHGYESTAEDTEKRYVLQPKDMEKFSAELSLILTQLPTLTNCCDELDILTARLAALNSMEGSVVLLHNEMTSNSTQSRQWKKPEDREIALENNLKEAYINIEQTDEDDINALKESILCMQDKEQYGYEAVRKKGTKSLILWTKEQMNIIACVGGKLLHPTSAEPCRMIVAGPKGSGKTMLLTYIARLTKYILRTRNKDYEGDVVIYDGRGGASQILFDKLKVLFDGSGIEVAKGWSSKLDFQSKRDMFQNRALILFDECIGGRTKNLLSHLKALKRHQHAIIFSSDPDIFDIKDEIGFSSYKSFRLSTTLRSTCGVNHFVERFRLLDPLCNAFPCTSSHNLEGEGPVVRIVEIDPAVDPEQLQYVSKAVEAISKSAEQARGLTDILVTPYVHPIVLQRIIVELYKRGFDYEYKNPVDYQSKSVPIDRLSQKGCDNNTDDGNRKEEGNSLPPLPLITFVTGNHVDGSEYGAVVVLLERSLPHYWDGFIFDSLFIALTRATTKLGIVINNTEAAPLITQPPLVSNENATPTYWKKVWKHDNVSIPAYSFIEAPLSFHTELLKDIVKDSCWVKYPVLVLGELPYSFDWEEISQTKSSLSYISKNDQRKHQHCNYCDLTRWFLGPNDKLVICTTSLLSLECHLGDSLGHHGDKRIEMYSAIVFLLSSLKDHTALDNVNRHRLLFDMYENHLGSCAIHIISPFPLFSSRLGSAAICNKLSEQTHLVTNNDFPPSGQTEEKNTKMQNDADCNGDTRDEENSCVHHENLEDVIKRYKTEIKKNHSSCESSSSQTESRISRLYSTTSKKCSEHFSSWLPLPSLSAFRAEEALEPENLQRSSKGKSSTSTHLSSETIELYVSPLENIFSGLKSKIKRLKKHYQMSVAKPGCNVEYLIKVSDRISSIYCDMSKICFVLGKFGYGIKKVESSIQYADRSLQANPFSSNGYHRRSKAFEMLGESDNALTALRMAERVRTLSEENQKPIRREMVLEDIIKNSVSWYILKFKDNTYVIDINGQGHFTSIQDALDRVSKPTSFLVNPGVYQSHYPIIFPEHPPIDIVGNWVPEICNENYWITKDSPVVIQDILTYTGAPYSTFIACNAQVSLSRLSVYNWQLNTNHAIDMCFNSDIELYQCSFQSQCGVSLVCAYGSNLSITGCRSVGSYSAVLAIEDSSVDIQTSFFSKTAIVCLELREDVQARVEGCSIENCGGCGISSVRSNLVVKRCSFENNSSRMTANEGAIQLHCSYGEISDTLIQYQCGNGIVIEFGSGTFDNIKIDRCKVAGMLINAPAMAQRCKISNCSSGVDVNGRMLPGKVELNNNTIVRCRYTVKSLPEADKPIIDGIVLSSCDGDAAWFATLSKELKWDLIQGESFHQRRKKFHQAVIKARNIQVIDSVLKAGVDGIRPCDYCSIIVYGENLANFIFCERCQYVFYCSPQCFESGKEFHKPICDNYVKCLKVYEDFLKKKKKKKQVVSVPMNGKSHSSATSSNSNIVVPKKTPIRKKKKGQTKKKVDHW